MSRVKRFFARMEINEFGTEGRAMMMCAVADLLDVS
jgi:hypothetical protein